ncbi:putative selenium metabolism hydrolase [Anaerosolibacter carboniphilus]|uniref:Putative selenium metabolism hydrolase n=1 Tax=Anaerosolibacter carboniphilus TaxID=1417629 RepID=A0A841KVL3_9FIRM|nr:YgeY family selenium metabolism-linked hydrolase [Anaerosolibacter carboniphilus]MBB6214225.1 putative selenium metabolism hydrolase [Anaerosolibacter carboniphilus]
MIKQIMDALAVSEEELVKFTQDLVRIKSYSGHEEEIVRFIAKKMSDLGYDEVIIDAMGNVVGRIGNGKKVIMFDSHVDTVEIKDEEKWDVPPFSGEIVDGKLYGRGSVDMKSGAAASIYAGAIAKQLGLDAGKTIYVSCTVFEEDCDGENLKHLFKERNIKPDYFITCEPSDNKIVTGHKGKAQISIKTRGISAYGSAPEKGKNAIYEMAEIIQRVEKTNEELMRKDGPRRTLVMSQISSVSVSLNAVPSECEVYLDRRMVVGETEDTIKEEMDQIVAGKNASWEIGTIYRKSWTGMDIKYEPFHLAWKIDLNHEFSRVCIEAYMESFGSIPVYDYWDFSTNAVTTVSMGIPTIGFGPGAYKLAHCRNENCEVGKIVDACNFYMTVIHRL